MGKGVAKRRNDGANHQGKERQGSGHGRYSVMGMAAMLGG